MGHLNAHQSFIHTVYFKHTKANVCNKHAKLQSIQYDMWYIQHRPNSLYCHTKHTALPPQGWRCAQGFWEALSLLPKNTWQQCAGTAHQTQHCGCLCRQHTHQNTLRQRILCKGLEENRANLTCKEFLEVWLDDSGVGCLAKNLQQIIIPNKIEAWEGRALLLQHVSQKSGDAYTPYGEYAFFTHKNACMHTSRNSLSDFWQRCNWSSMVTSEFLMPALELRDTTLLSLWISDIIDLLEKKRTCFVAECTLDTFGLLKQLCVLCNRNLEFERAELLWILGQMMTNI